jgi:hypothetical protein
MVLAVTAIGLLLVVISAIVRYFEDINLSED